MINQIKMSNYLPVHIEICLNFYVLDSRSGHFGNMQIKKNATTFIKCYHAEMESRGLEDSENVKTSQAYFFEGSISFFEDFSLTNLVFIVCDNQQFMNKSTFIVVIFIFLWTVNL